MSPSTAKAKVPQALKLTAALAATSGALHQTLLAVLRAQGVNGAAWLDQLEAQFVRNTKNMTFTGCSMDAEAGAVEAALANLKTITTAVREQIARSSAQASPPPKESIGPRRCSNERYRKSAQARHTLA